MIVVDASVVVAILLQDPGASGLKDRIATDADLPHAPHLLDLEVAQVLRRGVRAGHLDPAHGLNLLGLLGSWPLLRHPHHDLLEEVWGMREHLTAYDAAYVALARRLDATLITRDARLVRAPGLRARVELV